MLSPRWRKVLRDLWSNKTRTILVVLSIAVGVFAVGMIAGSRVIMQRDLAAAYADSRPYNATLYTDWFDDDLVQVVRHMPGGSEAEGRHTIGARLKIGPDEWRPIQLIAVPDYNDIRVNRLRPLSGAWPPADRELLLERGSLGSVNARVGDTLLIETSDRKQHRMRIAGLAHDLNQIPTFWSGTVNAYITFDTLEWLGEPRAYNALNIIVAEHGNDKARIQQVADAVGDKVQKSGRTVYWTEVPEPGRHWSSDNLNSMVAAAGHPRAARAAVERLPGRQHDLGAADPADPADWDHEGDRRPRPADRVAVPGHGADLRPAGAAGRGAAGRARRIWLCRLHGRADELRYRAAELYRPACWRRRWPPA